MSEEIRKALDGELFAVWFLIGAALVFWMQAGFAMVETGFARAKNAGWRIDYFVVSESLLPKIEDAQIYSDALG